MTEVAETKPRAEQVVDSTIRTAFLPLVVVFILDTVFKLTGIDLGAYQSLLTVVVGFIGYAAVRFLEVYASPRWGYILGLGVQQPTYVGKYGKLGK